MLYCSSCVIRVIKLQKLDEACSMCGGGGNACKMFVWKVSSSEGIVS
jgi:hypothetical protein